MNLAVATGTTLAGAPLATVSNASTVQGAKIDKSSKDFESILLGSWLQEAEQSFAKVPGTDEEEGDDDGTAQMQQGLATQQLGQAMAESGGIGIAKMIASQLRASAVGPSDPTIEAGLNKSLQLPISRVMP